MSQAHGTRKVPERLPQQEELRHCPLFIPFIASHRRLHRSSSQSRRSVSPGLLFASPEWQVHRQKRVQIFDSGQVEPVVDESAFVANALSRAPHWDNLSCLIQDRAETSYHETIARQSTSESPCRRAHRADPSKWSRGGGLVETSAVSSGLATGLSLEPKARVEI